MRQPYTTPGAESQSVPNRAGATLLELLVALTLIAIIASVAALPLTRRGGGTAPTVHTVMDACARAATTGTPVRATVMTDSGRVMTTCQPNGVRIISVSHE